jgi:uncharacterized protein YbjT (DUF2867 family)
MRVLVLGGNGLIGETVVRALAIARYEVTGLGREIRGIQARLPNVTWLSVDIRLLSRAAAWEPILSQVNPVAIVNCAGSLQDGWRDNVSAVQSSAMRALYEASQLQGCRRFVQISATRASAGAETAFMRSKGEADDALRTSGLDWTILRPGLVVAPQAYGGTALLRALASAPSICLIAFPDSQVQTVSVDDVAGAVVAVIEGRVPSRQTYDLVEDEPQPLRAVVAQTRAWIGLSPAPVLEIPRALSRVMARIGDGLGWLGWRAPLRSTAMIELAAGIRGDPAPWRAVTGTSLSPLKLTLARLPSTVQERWFARTFILKPVAICILSVFWIATGLVAISHLQTAARTLTDHGIPTNAALALVLAGSLTDIGLGCALLVRTWCVRAAQGMILLTLAYLVGGTLIAPGLWGDPLGPLLKAVPILALCLVPLAVADDR